MNPGSDEAVANGCTCPRDDNDYGKAVMFIVAEDCPLHWKELIGETQ